MDENEIKDRLSYNIRVERVKRHWKQEFLAEKANISTKHLSKIENNSSTPSVHVAYKIASAFGISIDALLKEPEI